MKRFQKIAWQAALTAVLLAIIVFSYVRWRSIQALDRSAEEIRSASVFRVSRRPLLPAAQPGFEWISSPSDFADAAGFKGHLFLAGLSGVTEYDARGGLLKEYRVGRELPASPVVQLAVGKLADGRGPELLIATAREGIVAYDGSGFRSIRPERATIRMISAILPVSSGRLLIGTERNGVLVYDGEQVRAFHPTLKDLFVTTLAGREEDLWIGTLNDGVIHYQGGRSERFSEEQKLPDAHVYSLAVDGERVFVGTALGVTEFESGKLKRSFARNIFARALLLEGKSLLVGTFEQGVMEIATERARPGAARHGGATREAEIVKLLRSAESTYALARDGIYLRDANGSGWRRVLERPGSLLADGNIAALDIDSRGRLWVGYFDRGLDVMTGVGSQMKAHHVEDEHVFCVNRIVEDTDQQRMAVATANGLVMFDSNAEPRQVLTRSDGLIADHVTDLVIRGKQMAVATPAGLTFFDESGAHSVFAFHGLVNNHVYALGAGKGGQLLAGTLGGISVLEGDVVQANLTTATSALKHNWITAILPVGDGFMVGTYGAGV
ncbi:MAG: hypothetical protein HYX26_10810, partial [Acidobacteriales bacterium]|nr:hypothetical protein [Terriglobales bacterium]